MPQADVIWFYEVISRTQKCIIWTGRWHLFRSFRHDAPHCSWSLFCVLIFIKGTFIVVHDAHMPMILINDELVDFITINAPHINLWGTVICNCYINTHNEFLLLMNNSISPRKVFILANVVFFHVKHYTKNY
jgi:hypothetical protein